VAPLSGGGRRWLVLAAGMLAMTAGCAFQFGLPFLIPAFRAEGRTLAECGLLTGAPVAGMLTTLIAWGAAADRWGERRVLTAGLGSAGAILLAATTVDGTSALAVVLFAAGASSAAVNASSGRLILGWFPAGERGLAMGLRQTSQPLGVAVAALVLPGLARPGALVFLGAFCLSASALAVAIVRDPPAPAEATTGGRSPYRTPVLWRIHAASALLVVPQCTVATFALVFLVDAHGWHAPAAGRVLAIGQVAGAAARLGAGWWSDRLGSRLPLVRVLALVIAFVLAVLAAGGGVAALLVAGILTVSPNGLAYTAVAEHAGRAWAGRALGLQNTVQNLTAAATAPAMAAVIAAAGYGTAFAATIAFPLAAAAVLPLRAGPAGQAVSRRSSKPDQSGDEQ
jgi:sugar phosphate permease